MPIQQLQHGHGVSITPNDNAYIWQQLFYTYKVYTTLYVGGAGDLHVLTAGGDDITFSSVPAGTFLPVHVAKVFASGTTATGIIALDITTQPTDFTGLLDTYSGAAAAYSLRQLSSSYSGSAIRVRRSSDNAEQDIGFASNELDTTALTAFCGAGNGFVTTWYDQSGNSNDATQTTAASQPQIVSSGSVITENGKPSVQFDGSNDFVQHAAISGSAFSGFAVSSGIYTAFGAVISSRKNLGAFTQNGYVVLYGDDSPTNTFFGQTRDGTTFQISQFTNGPTTQQLISLINDSFGIGSSTQTLYQNNVQKATNSTYNPISYSVTNQYCIGADNSTGNFLNGKIQEVILYTSNQMSNTNGINNNINDFYSIY